MCARVWGEKDNFLIIRHAHDSQILKQIADGAPESSIIQQNIVTFGLNLNVIIFLTINMI